MEPFWTKIRDSQLRQGDFLPGCYVPSFHPEFGSSQQETERVLVKVYDLIVITQSCDLENEKSPLVALSPIFSISKYEDANPKMTTRREWENVRRGRVEGLHLLASPDDPSDNQKALVVNFREVYSLPVDYLKKHAEQSEDRWRLNSPFLEHFSQSFARFFMRVGLPSTIPSYKNKRVQ